MESWGYVPAEEKGYVTNNDTLSPPCSSSTLGRTKSSFLGWELNTPCTFSNDMLGHQTIENHQGFDELGIPELVGKQLLPHDNITSTNTTTVVASPNAFFGRGYSNSKLSNSVVDSNGRDSLIDLKLGRFDDHGDGAMDKALFSKAAPILSSSESSTAPKRVRASGLNSQTAYCQVYGCNKDLSSCKDYHKRHKVCEVHSKTAIVIVNGIEQRFCQQCSRFHLLAEFDDGKRSCRKRLAGHNERRRKPQAGIHSGKAGRLLQPCGDSRFQGNMLTSASFICSEMLPSGVIPSEKYGMSGLWKPSKAEHGNGFRILSSMPVSNGHPQSRSPFPLYNEVEKQFPFLHENGASANAGSIFCESNSQYKNVLGTQNFGPRSLFQDTSLGSEDFNVFDTASTVHGFSGISDTRCALSLLSSQSQNSSSQSSGIPFTHPLLIPSSHSHPASGTQLSPILISDNNDIVNFEMADGIFQGSDYANAKDRLSCEDVATIDLLQLSSQLQRVEHQRQSLQAKQENDSSCTLRIT